jgi:beta-phosphoglucomutase family hydrolase
MTRLGLPDHVTAGLFDLDGVLTDTAGVHRAAWKATFDAFLARHGQAPFTEQDYATYVDGKPRNDGVRDFLASRRIHLPEGKNDPSSSDTVHGIGDQKNGLVAQCIGRHGVAVYDGSRRYLTAARNAGPLRAVVSSSANTVDVLRMSRLDALVQMRIDGVIIKARRLRGKPAPDSFLAAAELLGVTPGHAAVFEDAIAGVAAGRAGGFGFVVGINRLDTEHGCRLLEHGADLVVRDLSELMEKPR